MKKQKGIGSLVGGLVSIGVAQNIINYLTTSLNKDDELQKIIKEKMKQIEERKNAQMPKL